MFARIEVAMRPEFTDPSASGLLRRIELAHPEIRRKIRWGRLLDVTWLDLPAAREDIIPAITEVFWDKVLQWLFTGNLIPSAAGKHGDLMDLMESAPNRPGKFWALERRFRGGVTDNVGRTTLEAFEIVLERKLEGGRASSGSLFLLEGQELTEDDLSLIARDVYCNELIETWTILPETELRGSNRFSQDRIKRDIPRIMASSSADSAAGAAPVKVDEIRLEGLAEADLEKLSRKKLWALSLAEMKAAVAYFSSPEVLTRRQSLGLSQPTDVEMEVIAQTWSEHCKHKIFNALIHYRETGEAAVKGPQPDFSAELGSSGGMEAEDGISFTQGHPGHHGPRIPAEIDSLFKTTIAGTTDQMQKPWLLSVFSDNAGIVAFDEEDAFCIKVETHNSPSALDPYGGALTGIVGVNRDILGCGMGAKPIFNTDVFCVAPLDYRKPLPDRLLHPRRILDGIRRGVEHGGNKSGIPTVNGALVFDERYLGKPLVYCGTGGFMPRTVAGVPCEAKEVRPGDRICMVGGRIGKDGIHGATFSSLALTESSPATAVQLGDPITQKRAADFLLEARDQGLYRAITDNGAGGLSSSVGEMAQASGGARMDVSKAATKYPGLKPYELVVSESQERMTVAVQPEKLPHFLELAARRGVEVSDIGEFTNTGLLDIFHGAKQVASLDLQFLHKGVPRLVIEAEWPGRPRITSEEELAGKAAWSGSRDLYRQFETRGAEALTELLSRPNIASKEWLIRQYDHEVQGTSVIKPLHTVGVGLSNAMSGPNDASVLKPKPNSEAGLAIGCGINPKLSDIDAYVMAQSAVDEALRNILCVGAEFGRPESVLALVDNFCWPDPVSDKEKAAALVRACYGMRDAALALSVPLVSGKDSMKNDYHGALHGKPVKISVPPTLLMTAVGRVPDVRHARTADFKRAGDVIYLLGGSRLGLWGSEFAASDNLRNLVPPSHLFLGEADWEEARRIYEWIGGGTGREQSKLRSLHDVSEGGLLVAIAEGLLARGMGAQLRLPRTPNPFAFAFGEGFHSFVGSISEADIAVVENEWMNSGIPFQQLGTVTAGERLDVTVDKGDAAVMSCRWSLDVRQLRIAWQRGGYWE